MSLRITDLKPGTPRRSLWDSFPLNTFINISALETFRSSTTVLAIRTWAGLPSLSLEEQAVGELPFGRLNLATCGGVASAYILSAPRCKIVSVGPNYAAISLRDSPDVSDVQMWFSDGTMTIMGSSTAIVAAIPSSRWIRR